MTGKNHRHRRFHLFCHDGDAGHSSCAGGEDKVSKTQSRPSTCFTSFRLWHHNVLKKSVRSRPLSAARCYFNTGYWRWPPRRLERGPTPDGALVWEQKGGGKNVKGKSSDEGNRKTNKSVTLTRVHTELCFPSLVFYLCKLCRVIKGDASRGCSSLGRMILERTDKSYHRDQNLSSKDREDDFECGNKQIHIKEWVQLRGKRQDTATFVLVPHASYVMC